MKGIFVAKKEAWLRLFGSLGIFVDEAKFCFRKSPADKGVVLSIKTVDPAHVAMMEVSVGIGMFQSWKIDGDVEVGFNLDEMESRIKKLDDGENVTIAIDDFPNALCTISQGCTEYRVCTVDVAGFHSVHVPNLKSWAVIKIFASTLRKAVKVNDGGSDHIRIRLSDGKLDFYHEDQNESGHYLVSDPVVEYPDAKPGEKISKEIQSIFPLDYFSNVVRIIPDVQVSLRLDKDYPLRIDYSDAKDDATYLILLAPRIEN